ncbi:MAG: LLM class flavin-dependent oxidoreductase [Pelagimonas sp.]|nr:LLM class flavin-dependent oxidoreductase [Pelagimonas sp.]
MSQFSCVLMGNESLLTQCGDMLLNRGNTVCAVITRNAGVQTWADKNDIPHMLPGQDLRNMSFDWLFSIANLDIIPEALLAMPAQGAINFHDGPLPHHAGLNAPVWAMIEGEAQHGITWHLIEGGIDEGDVLVQRSFDISQQDTALTLNTKAYEAALNSFPSLLDQLESGELHRLPQDLSQRSYHALADRPDGLGVLDFTRPASELERLVRALDHGPYWNPLSTAKIFAAGKYWNIGTARLEKSQAAPGTVLEIESNSLTIACGSDALILSSLSPIADQGDIANSLTVGDVLPAAPDTVQINQDYARIARFDGVFRMHLATLKPALLPGLGAESGAIEQRPIAIPAGLEGAAVALRWVQLQTGQTDVAYCDTAISDMAQTGLLSAWAPLRCTDDKAIEQRLKERAARSFALDILARAPEITQLTTPDIGLSPDLHVPGTALTVIFGDTPMLSYDSGRVSAELVQILATRLEYTAKSPDQLLPESERHDVLHRWNATNVDHDRAQTMQSAFEAQVDKTPDATALIFENQQLSYAELNARANRAAHVLRDMGVKPGAIVGLYMRRSVDLLVGALAVLKAGGAYLPMDPAYPKDRLRHFVDDSQAAVIITQATLEAELPPHQADILVLDAEPRLANAPSDNPQTSCSADDLAYLIYTSGSTGKPKGVMLEHRNVLNFYTGMDAQIDHADGGTWLAVTSLSFDISVLELFWTTARGLTVVLSSDEDRALVSSGAMPKPDLSMDFSIYYWGNDDGVGRDKYRLLLEGAQFADQNGFKAVWTPERHFHAFGGPYPNPSVTGAAVAAVTHNIGVRSGSVVAPLHHPARIAEEWAVIDNLTNGRAGLAVASGWQPDDFVLRPENTPPNNKTAMMESLDQVRRLWRGEAVSFPKADGSLHDVVTQPRPVTRELPVWLTIAGNPDTWRDAGLNGCHVLTHLLGQSIDEVAGKIKIYHDALREAGHDPKDFQVALMLHTFISDSREHARDIARQPMKDYLTSAAGLIKQYAWAFPAFKRPEGVNNAFDLQLDVLEPEEVDAILEFAFERYFNDSGLFGTVEDALARTEQLKKIGVTEIACLIDYGIDRETVLAGLEPLAEVVSRANATPDLAEDDFSIAAQILRHNVTHLQCTPSMARMFAMNDEARYALSGVKQLLLGGEPLPGALVKEFKDITDAKIINMYGPTETTIWSSCQPATDQETVCNIGLPLANQQMYVLDEDRQPVGIGFEGELWIGGEGVARGYWNRPELTDKQFVQNPFHDGRMYRTGDLVRRRADGRIDYVGRVDHQIKLRGFRIELGEIEATMEDQPGITQAVVAMREDTPGDQRLVGYYTGRVQDGVRLKQAMGQNLPPFMVPSRFVQLESFPMTPNKKVDRKALPAVQAKPHRKHTPTAPRPISSAAVSGTVKEDTAHFVSALSRIWSDILGVQGITGRDNFFELGGHSLLAVQAHRAIREQLGAESLSITDIFRFPVLNDLAARVAPLADRAGAASNTAAPQTEKTPEPAVTAQTAGRAQSRADAMTRRREMRARRRS